MAREKQGCGCGGCLLALLLTALAGFGLFAAAELGLLPFDLPEIDTSDVSGMVDRFVEGPVAQDEEENTIDDSVDVQLDASSAELYAYSQLNESDQELYRIVLDAMQSREPRDLPEITMFDLTRIREHIMADHPEIMYLDAMELSTQTNSATGEVVKTTVTCHYSMSAEEYEATMEQVDAAVAECLAGLSADTDDYEKAKYVFEWIALNTTYDQAAAERLDGVDSETASDGSNGQTIANVMLDHTAVCGGYARAYQYMLQQMGIQCAYVTGTANGGAHAWCVALLDGNYYYIDPTWGDPQFLSEDGSVAMDGFINYDYLCVNLSDLQTTHAVGPLVVMPPCKSYDDNYYVREGLWFESADYDHVSQVLANALDSGQGYVQFRCADESVYNTILNDYIVAGDILWNLGLTQYSYSSSDDLHSIIVSF
ncbi:transglutaminase domain-containing protein [Slackia heliotrinireducens]|uniref:transglutaminase domain-containing protein n=1 Tax=Slackia heliotrinireducens TaxID=84110 RepID=UPI003315A285